MVSPYRSPTREAYEARVWALFDQLLDAIRCGVPTIRRAALRVARDLERGCQTSEAWNLLLMSHAPEIEDWF